MTDNLYEDYPANTLPSYLGGDLSELEATSRRLCQTVNLGNGNVICRVLGKYIMYVDAEDVNITPSLCLNGYWESGITLAISRILKPGWYCVDIGSNHGYYTMIMADAVGLAGHVLAVEPNPKMVNLIALGLAINGFRHQVAVLQKAVSDTNYKGITLAVPRNHGINATVRRAPTQEDEKIEVETVTLDQLTNDWPRIDLIKIDAEGSEDAIWRGMRKTLERNPNITILMEFVCSRYADPKAFLHDIQEVGFKLRYIKYDSTIEEVAEDRLLSTSKEEDTIWMLFLHKHAN